MSYESLDKRLRNINFSNTSNFDDPSSNSAQNRASVQSMQYQQKIAELEAQNRALREQQMQSDARAKEIEQRHQAAEKKYNQKLSTKVGNAVKTGINTAKQNGSLVRQIAGDVGAQATGQLIGAASDRIAKWQKDKAKQHKMEGKLALKTIKENEKLDKLKGKRSDIRKNAKAANDNLADLQAKYDAQKAAGKASKIARDVQAQKDGGKVSGLQLAGAKIKANIANFKDNRNKAAITQTKKNIKNMSPLANKALSKAQRSIKKSK